MAKRILIIDETSCSLKSWALGLALILAFLSAATVLASAQQPAGRQIMPEKPWLQEDGPILSITKMASALEVSPGDVLTYTLVMSNTGDADATEVVISDALPAHVLFAWADAEGDLVSGEVQWTGKQVQAGERLTVTFAVTVTSPLTDGTEIVNGSYGLTCTQGVTASGQPVTVTVTGAPLLNIIKTASALEISPGNVLTYTLVVSNYSRIHATVATVTDTVPAHTLFAWADADGGLSGNQVVWNDKRIKGGESLTLTLVVTVTSPLTDETEIVNRSYGVTCAQGVGASGQPVTVTARYYYLHLPILVKDFSSVPPPPVCGDAIENGGFENGDANPEPWMESSAGGWGLIYPSSQMPVHGGAWGAWMAGYNNAHDELCQVIEIPETHTSATATWWWQMKTLQTSFQAVDTIRLEARPGVGLAPEILDAASNLSPANVWISNTVEISASGIITLCFVADSNHSLITDFYVDDVAVTVCIPGE